MSQLQETLSGQTRLLHGVIALSMITLLAVGIYMKEFEVYELYDLHKAVGAIVLVIALARVLVRIKEGWPTALGNMSNAQHVAAKAVHWILIVATVLYPLSGLMMSIGGGHGLSIFGWEVVAETVDAVGEVVPVNAAIGGLGHEIHELLTFFVIAAIVLHVVGALKHHFIDKDDTIRRMFSAK